MKKLLIEIKKEVDSNWNTANALTLDITEVFEGRYAKIIKDGFAEDYNANRKLCAKKKVKRSTSLNLLNRLSAHEEELLAFMYDFNTIHDSNYIIIINFPFKQQH